MKALTQTNVAQPALGVVGMCLSGLLTGFGVEPDMAGGHSYGEYVALWRGGVLDESSLIGLSEARGRCIIEAAEGELGTMAAVAEGADKVGQLIGGKDGVWIANLNSPRQTIISGTAAGVDTAIELLRDEGIRSQPAGVSCAFHSPLVEPARERLADILAGVDFGAAAVEVYSNSTGEPYPEDPEAARALLAAHLVSPVRFRQEIDAMYEAGARVFVEVGPRDVLTNLARQTLGDQPHLAVATDIAGRNGIVQLLHALGSLAAHGVPLELDSLFDSRGLKPLPLDALVGEAAEQTVPPTAWLVNGGRARPQDEPAAAQAPKRTPVRVAVTAADATETQTVGRDVEQGGTGSDREQVILKHQQLTRRLIESQERVMLAYLGGEAEPTSMAAAPDLPLSALEPSAGVGAGPETTILDMAEPPALAEEETAAAPQAASAAQDRPDPTERLLQIVSDRTGYPSEILNLGLDISADLGIDSIKWVEILGALRSALPDAVEGRMEGSMDHFVAAKTLGEVVALLAEMADETGTPSTSIAAGESSAETPPQPLA